VACIKRDSPLVDAVADAVALHKPEDVLDEPARIAKLDDVGVPLQRDSQEALESRQVDPPTGGELVEHRAKDFAQLASPLILLTLDQPQAQPLKSRGDSLSNGSS
jgi:hypothetical protein